MRRHQAAGRRGVVEQQPPHERLSHAEHELDGDGGLEDGRTRAVAEVGTRGGAGRSRARRLRGRLYLKAPCTGP